MTTVMIYMNEENGFLSYDQAFPDLWVKNDVENIVFSDLVSLEFNHPDYKKVTDEQVLISAAIAKGIETYFLIDDSTFPDNYFRSAWLIDSNGSVYIDMPKAREVHINNLRYFRHLKIDNLDVAWSRAMAKGDNITALAVEAKRQALRDITKDAGIAAATTPDELKLAGMETINEE